MIDRLVDYLESRRRISLPVMSVLLVLLISVFIWQQTAMWLVILASPLPLSFGNTILFYLYVGSTALFVLMPFAVTHEINNGETSNSGKEFAKKPETTAISRYLEGLRNESVAENKCNDTKKDSYEATNSHTSSVTGDK